ncbi:hypothetical protein J3R82DRAFT_5608 [Butyriboletus roseoflavus]|nr:hypothetical protein J3R82DRAFT_5608 [Butyriboletus roseoflavus]
MIQRGSNTNASIPSPQPFSIDEIDVCGRVFPQPLVTDRLIMDKQVFLANIVVENAGFDDLCESLQVPYSHIRTITLDNAEENVSKGKVLIMVYLTSPPLVANVDMESPGGSHLYAKFLLQNDAVSRFMEALRRRGVGKLCFLSPLTRVQRKRKSISIGSGLKFIDDSSPIPPTASFEGKVQHVNQVYKTDIEDSTTSEAVPAPHVGDVGSSPTPNSKPAFKDEDSGPEVSEFGLTEDVPTTLRSTRLIPPTNKSSKPIQNFTLPFSPGNSTGAIQLFGDGDELSEISEFEPDHEMAIKLAATGVSTSCNHELKPTQHKIDRMHMIESSSTTSATGIKKSSESVSKTGDCTKGVAQKSPETGIPLLTPDSPIFGSSSSTQINVSPKALSNIDTLLITAGNEVNDGLSVVSQEFVGTERLKELAVGECGSCDTELIIASARKPPAGFSSAKDEPGQHARRFTSSSGVNQKGYSRIEITKDTSVPPKIAGSRRKRETIKSSSKAISEVDDEPTPPRKKSRDDRLGIKEDKVKSDKTSLAATFISKAERHSKTVKGAPSGVDPMKVDFDELREVKSTCQETRRSSRIRKRQTVATSGARANGMRNKTQRWKPADGTSIKLSHGTPSILGSRPIPILTRESPFPNNSNVPLVELSADNITSEASNILPCKPSQSAKEPQRDLDFGQQDFLDALQLTEEQYGVKPEETIDDGHLGSDLRTVDNDVSQVQGVVEHSVSLKKSEDSVELSRPVVESTPRTETVTIDLTIDNSPAREESELHKASVDPVRSEANIQTKFRTSDCIAVEEPASVPSPRHIRRSVTFASPIEYVLDKKVKSKMQVSSSSRRSPSPSKSNIISPLRIPTGTVNMSRESPDQITPRATLQNLKSSQADIKASVHSQTCDVVGIQDIVEILNEIQAVIIKGISDKFRNIKRDVQHGRDELIQQVLDEIQCMVVENAKYFNELVRLEEDYYKNGKAITYCWEELIDCNDDIAVQFQNALKEHDQSVSARTFPKSLLPLQPVFLCRRANA